MLACSGFILAGSREAAIRQLLLRQSPARIIFWRTPAVSPWAVGPARTPALARQHQLERQFVGPGGHANSHAGFDTQNPARAIEHGPDLVELVISRDEVAQGPAIGVLRGGNGPFFIHSLGDSRGWPSSDLEFWDAPSLTFFKGGFFLCILWSIRIVSLTKKTRGWGVNILVNGAKSATSMPRAVGRQPTCAVLARPGSRA